MSPLLAAIITKFGATAGITALVPNQTSGTISCFEGEAIVGSVMPYFTFHVITSPTNPVFGGNYRYTATIQFVCMTVGSGASLAGATAMKAFTDAFDDVLLTLTTGKNFDSLRTSEPWPLPSSADVNRNETDARVSAWAVTYDFSVY